MTDLPTHRTNSKGQPELIADMHYAHLVSSHAKAVRTEERAHTDAAAFDREYDNPQAEAEIAAMKAEIDRRDAARANEDGPR